MNSTLKDITHLGDIPQKRRHLGAFRIQIRGWDTLASLRVEGGRAMANSLVLIVIGPDRPGIVDALSTTIAAHGANWLESRMAHLAGHFAGLLRVSVPDAQTAALRRALRALEGEGLRVLVEAGAATEPDVDSRALALELVGLDRPGIIRDVSRALSLRGVNVEELETSCQSAPMSGETLFRARAKLRVPASAELEELRATLEKIAGELMVDLSLDEQAP